MHINGGGEGMVEHIIIIILSAHHGGLGLCATNN